MNSKYVSIIIVLAVVGIGVWLYLSGDHSTNPDVANITAQNQNQNQDNFSDNATQTLPTNNNNSAAQPATKTMATLHTSMGDITFEFYDKDAPNTVANFQKLVTAGFYNGIKFHRVIKGFMIQGGDPLTKDDSKMAIWGTGDPGYKFADEINTSSDIYKTGYVKGVVAMANSGPNTNGSQFFIMTADNALPPAYTIFGHVTAGQDVVDKIAGVSTTTNDRPVTAVVINSVTLK